MDHLVPIIRGGKSTKGNLVPSCKACNPARKHRLPFEDAATEERHRHRAPWRRSVPEPHVS